MNFSEWLQTWLARHPLKEPIEIDPSRYTAHVMARIRVLAQPAAAPARAGWRSWALAFALPVAAVLALLIARAPRWFQEVNLASHVEREVRLLTALGESPANGDPDELAEELETSGALVLAEDLPSQDAWIAQTVQLFESLDEDLSDSTATPSPDEEEWLEEFQMLDAGDGGIQS